MFLALVFLFLGKIARFFVWMKRPGKASKNDKRFVRNSEDLRIGV